MNPLPRHAGVHLDVDGEAGAFQPAHLLRGPDDRRQRVLSERLHVLLREAAHYQDCGLAAARDACFGERPPRARALTRASDAKPRRSGAGQSRRAELNPVPVSIGLDHRQHRGLGADCLSDGAKVCR